MRLTILGGYLGSGKTTWLRHQLHADSFGRVHVVVNEAAETPVDDALLGRAFAMTVLAGGCACCTGRADLIATLRDLCDQRSRLSADQDRLDKIVLETSGLADPAAIVAAIQSDPVLVNHIVVAETIVMVDALHAAAQLKTEPLGRLQIEAADRLILTKVDACDPAALLLLRATLAVLNPTKPAEASVRGDAVLMAPLPEGAPSLPLACLSPDDTVEPIQPARLHIPPDIDWPAFTLWLSALLHVRGDTMVRVKGVVRTPAGRLLVQAVRNVVQSPEILPEPEQGADPVEDNIVVFIGRRFRVLDLNRSLHHFAGLPRPPLD
ncbi:MAG: GTP-binding protein [Pseudomonadota bacterium]